MPKQISLVCKKLSKFFPYDSPENKHTSSYNKNQNTKSLNIDNSNTPETRMASTISAEPTTPPHNITASGNQAQQYPSSQQATPSSSTSSSSSSTQSNGNEDKPEANPTDYKGIVKKIIDKFSAKDLDQELTHKITRTFAEIISHSEAKENEARELAEQNKALLNSIMTKEAKQREEAHRLGRELIPLIEPPDESDRESFISSMRKLIDQVPPELVPDLNVIFTTQREASVESKNRMHIIATERFRQESKDQTFKEAYEYLSGTKRTYSSNDSPSKRFKIQAVANPSFTEHYQSAPTSDPYKRNPSPAKRSSIDLNNALSDFEKNAKEVMKIQ